MVVSLLYFVRELELRMQNSCLCKGQEDRATLRLLLQCITRHIDPMPLQGTE